MMLYLNRITMKAMSARMKKINPEGVARLPKTCLTHLVNLDSNQAIISAAMIPMMTKNPLTAGD